VKESCRTCPASRACSGFLRQLVCPYSTSVSYRPRLLLYEVARIDQNNDRSNNQLSNVGLVDAVTRGLCPAWARRSCVFVDASSIESDIGGYSSGNLYHLAVGFQASPPPSSVTIYLVDDSLASLCQRPEIDFFGGLRGSFSLVPSSARDVRDHRSVEVTPVLLQLTRRRELVRGGKPGWGWGWWDRTHTRDRNSYRATLEPNVVYANLTIFADTSTTYPVLAPEDVSSTTARWSEEAYRNSTVTPLLKEFWRDNGTSSYYINLGMAQLGEVVTYTQHPTDPVALSAVTVSGVVGSHACRSRRAV
jgi:hypothetical protein